jgi:microcystin-dependent protein
MTLESPIGSIVAFAGPVNAAFEVANGWLLCDGRSLNRTSHDTANAPFMPLFNAIGSSWGGDGVNNFNIPDLRGRFLRGVDNGTGRDPDVARRRASNPGGHDKDQVGSLQDDQAGPHNHAVTDNGHAHPASDSGHAHGVTDPGHAHAFQAFDTDGDGGVRNAFPSGARNVGTAGTKTGITATDQGSAAITVAKAGTGITVDNTNTSESRPRNVNVFWIIRYK